MAPFLFNLSIGRRDTPRLNPFQLNQRRSHPSHSLLISKHTFLIVLLTCTYKPIYTDEKIPDIYFDVIACAGYRAKKAGVSKKF